MEKIFINLPVKNVKASINFYTQMGFTANPLFSFDDQKCVAWSEQIYVMLQTHDMFKSGSEKHIPDTINHATATFTLPVENINRVNEIIENGLKAGGKESKPMRDEGFMKVRTIEDPDGHHWSIIYLNVDKFKETTGKQ
jgi:predicted lactoylglutathione lyase